MSGYIYLSYKKFEFHKPLLTVVFFPDKLVLLVDIGQAAQLLDIC